MFGLFKKKPSAGKSQPTSPSFIIVGAQKSGTSTLYEMLCKHPNVHHNEQKELHFFDFNFDKGKTHYREQLSCPEGMVSGDASPFYMYHPAVAGRIAKAFPKAKMIFILRDPAERALSHYRMNTESGVETLSPLMALVAEEDRLLKAMQAGDSWDTPNSAYQNFTYKSRGHYETQWMNFSKHFPRKQLFVLRMETLIANPSATMQALTKFLELPAHNWSSEQLPHENSSKGIGADEGYAREYLSHYFTPHKNRLKAWVPLSVGSWDDLQLNESSTQSATPIENVDAESKENSDTIE
jgi:hypothetical protein